MVRCRVGIAALSLFMLSGCAEIVCDNAYIRAGLRRLPAQATAGTCDSFICEDTGYRATLDWVQKIRDAAKDQPDYCARKSFEGWADYYKDRADRNRADWEKELRARAIEQRMVAPK